MSESEYFLSSFFPEEAERLARVAGMLWRKGWAEWRAGNFTVDVTGVCAATPHFADIATDASRCYLVSAAGARMRDLARNVDAFMLLLSVPAHGDARILHGPPGLTPTSELPAHLALHRALRERSRRETTLLHAHPTALIAMTRRAEFHDGASFVDALLSMHAESRLLHPAGVGFVDYLEAGTEALAAATLDALGDASVVVWRGHGAIAVGSDPDDAFDKMDVLAKCAEIYLASR